MKAISLWQPWASAVAVGSKRIETRSWSTHYRGPLAIHAAQRYVLGELIHHTCTWSWCGALLQLGWDMGKSESWNQLPFGAVIAVCDLIDVRPTGSFTLAEIETPRRPAGQDSNIYDWTERQLGNFKLGRYGWILENIRALEQPIPFKGKQGFFNVPDELLTL